MNNSVTLGAYMPAKFKGKWSQSLQRGYVSEDRDETEQKSTEEEGEAVKQKCHSPRSSDDFATSIKTINSTQNI